ncbi:hypothetical protein CEXT_316091 [Caerostris extrusa]|uniref:Uncharacterized protein n=1 Tax=Caerostris extrusa TaxID=172846 RepID=A0AAV4W8D6_CAEEX|nr:hypothetical protein CEXT_316091 [Caerostris extrusa]
MPVGAKRIFSEEIWSGKYEKKSFYNDSKRNAFQEAVRASTKYQRLQVILPSLALFVLKSHGCRHRFSESIDLVLLMSFHKDSRRNTYSV